MGQTKALGLILLACDLHANTHISSVLKGICCCAAVVIRCLPPTWSVWGGILLLSLWGQWGSYWVRGLFFFLQVYLLLFLLDCKLLLNDKNPFSPSYPLCLTADSYYGGHSWHFSGMTLQTPWCNIWLTSEWAHVRTQQETLRRVERLSGRMSCLLHD